MENIAILVPFFSIKCFLPRSSAAAYFVERLNFFFSFLFLLLRLVCECLRAFWLCAEGLRIFGGTECLRGKSWWADPVREYNWQCSVVVGSFVCSTWIDDVPHDRPIPAVALVAASVQDKKGWTNVINGHKMRPGPYLVTEANTCHLSVNLVHH